MYLRAYVFVCVMCVCVRVDACMNTYVVYDTYERQTRTLRILAVKNYRSLYFIVKRRLRIRKTRHFCREIV